MTASEEAVTIVKASATLSSDKADDDREEESLDLHIGMWMGCRIVEFEMMLRDLVVERCDCSTDQIRWVVRLDI